MEQIEPLTLLVLSASYSVDMILACLLSKEHASLPRAELEAVLRSLETEFQVKRAADNLLLVETEDEFADYAALSRLAMTREISKIVSKFSYQQLSQSSNETLLNLNLSQGKSFAVRSKSITREVPHNLEGRVGSLIQQRTGSKVDLDDPDVSYHLYSLRDRLWLGRLELEIDRSQYEMRKNQNRSFSHPTSLHPRLARAMVNLAGVNQGDSVLDPFLGTGGILIEAGLIGCRLYGADIAPEMIQGAKTNLTAYNLDQFCLKQGDVKQLDSLFPEQRFEAIVTDTPYGRASKKIGKALANFVEQIKNFKDTKVVFMSHKAKIGDLEADFSIYVHKNLTKYLYCLN